MKETKSYTAPQNLWYVIRTCWGASRGILYYTLAAAAIHLSASLAELLIVPAILGKVETAAPLGELLGTILAFTLALLVLSFLRTYSNYMRELFDSRLLHHYAVTINEKNCTTAYVNLLDTRYLRAMEQARAAACNDTNCAPTALLDAVGRLLTAVVGFVLYLLVLTGLPPLLLAVVAVTAAISFFVSRKVNQWGYDHREERREYRGRMLYVTNTVLSNEMPKDIRIFHLQNWLLELHDKTMALHQSFCDREQLHYFLGKAVDALLTLARNGVAYVYLIRMALEEGMSVAAFLLYFGAVTGFTTWITNILNNVITIHKQSLRISEIRELLEWPEPYRREDGAPIPAAENYELRLEDVSFRYPEADHDTISHMDLTIRPGEKLAIVGLNGAGKTTLVKLLCGLLDPTGGRVLLNGQDIRDFDRRAYYALFTAVFQDFCWLAGTVASNVAQRERDIDYDKVRRCVEKAGLSETVEKLPQGVDTHLGKVVYDDGMELSGGQLQRLMLARALYKDAPLLVLDEPTAALDPIAENDMYLRYNEMVGDRTAVYISHRLASTRFCDRILFLRDGAIAEEGDHEELMARGGGYAELFAVQSKYYREGEWTMKTEKTRTMREALALHWWAVKTWWRIEPKLFLSTGLYALLDTVTPYVTIWLSARIVGELAGARDPDTLWRWVLLTVLVSAALKLATDGAYHWKETVHALEIEQEDRMRVVKMMDLDFAAVDSTEFRDLMFSVYKHQFGNVYGFSKVQSWYLETLVGGVASIVGAAALTASLFSQQVPQGAGTPAVMNSPWVNAAMVALLLAGVILSPLCEARSVSCFEKMWPYNNRYNRCFNFFALLGGWVNRAPDVRIYNMQVVAREAMEETYPLFHGRPAWRIFVGEWALFRSIGTAVSTLLVGLVYVFVCLKAWAGAFGVGYITQYVGAITRLCGGITQLFGALGDMRANSACLADLRRYMEIPNDMYQGSLTTEKRSDNQYEVEFRDVSFKYPGSETYALHHVNMKFQVGRRLAVVGQNGSGKTTFIKLLCRLYDPTEGEILLNGIDIRKYRYDDYMDIFSVVFQDFNLLSLPLGQNVASGQTCDEARVRKSLEEAGFGPRLKEMPKGLDTYLYKDLEKDGVEISGGEAQKIAIARALYKKSAFLILDEPTAALDPVAEAEIYAHLNDIVGDRTCIYISHRLSSCRFCDDIAVFDHGGVVQQGSHETLVADEAGKYHELWYAQAQYYVK